jgi:signal transduction histidine kinase
MSAENFEEQVEELLMMQRVDQELNSTLNVENVMMITLDWAMRRTGAAAGMLCTMTTDGSGLVPLVTLGYEPDQIKHSDDFPLSISEGIIGRAARTRKVQMVEDVQRDTDYIPYSSAICTAIAAPIEMRGRLLGVISLEGDQFGKFTDNDASFLKRLTQRAAIALDNARLYKETEHRAESMSALYAASRLVSSTIERTDVLKNAAQAVAGVLSVSGVLILDYHAGTHKLGVVTAHQAVPAPHTPERLPEVGAEFDVQEFTEFDTCIRQQRLIAVTLSDHAVSNAMRRLMDSHLIRSLLIMPLSVQDQRIGVAVAVEGRRERRFLRDEIMMAESLSGQIALALRQAGLYEDVRELESLKSEMIRMASHDLRNPLGNAMGYLELLVSELTDKLDPMHEEFVTMIRNSLNTIKNLIEDLLTLEKIESERQASWTKLDFSALLAEVFLSQRLMATQKQHEMSLTKPDDAQSILGSSTQIRQALVNLIGNAIKYTPDNGKIDVRLRADSGKLFFEVEDNGYGVSKEKQSRLFQRFFRAREPHTDHIPGTGLGLSLVKTVIERHGGDVYATSAPGKGSTFGFWLPLAEPDQPVKQQQPSQ